MTRADYLNVSFDCLICIYIHVLVKLFVTASQRAIVLSYMRSVKWP